MTTLITGGTGFIGAEIVRMLTERDEGPVHVAHRSGNFGRLAGLEDRVELHHLDLADPEATEAVVAAVAPTRLFHFGAILTGPGEADPQTLLTANAVGFIRMIEAARLAGTEQMIFASSIGTYGRDLGPGPVTDLSLQRPNTVYGVTKVFGENLGAYYRTKYGLDFRGLRYPSIVGPGVTTWSLAQYTSWMIEKPALGEPFTVWATPDTVIPILYYKDAARAALDLAAAPLDSIKAINYLVDGVAPTPNAGEIAEAVRRAVPEAEITFEPDPKAALSLARNLRIDDATARAEWGWTPQYDLDAMVADIVAEVR
ncbi:MAG: NAD-dependent epimerase/dehydratase family protein [Acidimicrobiia bacterium]|nr:NAD-dependent epimerase/dehydratase family protein [Acidimicrobiia bacterium]MDH5289006.1 NAD-dependent epimerase/dehydratase family protein [Acidimicrobiia bacterium]